MSSEDRNAWFHTTQWSVVLAARDANDTRAEDALADLCQTYWRPLYTFLRRSGNSPHDAQDLTQSFFAQLIDKDFLKSVDRQKGRFRSFLLAAIKHFVATRRAHDRAIKRGGTWRQIVLDFADAETFLATGKNSSESPDFEFEYNWAITVLDRALDTVRDEFGKTSKQQDFEHLKPYLTPNGELPSYKELGERLGLGESGARSAVHRLRRRYRRALREHVAQTVDKEDDIEAELQELMRILSKN